jgi:hypothetical protein
MILVVVFDFTILLSPFDSYVVKAEKRCDAVNPKIDAAQSRRKSQPLFKHRAADKKKKKK